MITADLLTRISLFAKVPENERASLAARAADIHLRQGEWLIVEGQAPAFYGLLQGRIDVWKNVGRRDQRLTSYGPGAYFGEVPLLLGSSAIASLQAAEPSRLMRLEPADFLYLVSHCPVLSSEITKTMAERVGRISQLVADTPAPLVTVIGHAQDPACYDLREFLSRNRIEFIWQQPGNGSNRSRNGENADGPVVVLGNGRPRLQSPSFRKLAEALELQTEPTRDGYDLVIVGGGPTGLASAVYGASEGLRTLLVERIACGGQAGTSSRIENYLGFPGGLSGDELSDRAYKQAIRFGAELLVSRAVTQLVPADTAEEGACHTVVLDEDTRVPTQAVILATGVEWRQLSVPDIDRLVGHGVYYGAARTEAMRMQGKRVHLIGGGNSAGQAALLFADYAKSVTMLVRGPSLAASMSQYLIDQLKAKDDVITVENEVEVVGVEGTDVLEAIQVLSGPTRRRERRESDALFVLIGGQAATSWLPDRIIRDQWGYVCTGRDVMDLLPDRAPDTWPLERDPFLLETSVPGILAAGDVRHGSIKRCSAGVGEGCTAIAVVHQYLAELSGAVR